MAHVLAIHGHHGQVEKGKLLAIFCLQRVQGTIQPRRCDQDEAVTVGLLPPLRKSALCSPQRHHMATCRSHTQWTHVARFLLTHPTASEMAWPARSQKQNNSATQYKLVHGQKAAMLLLNQRCQRKGCTLPGQARSSTSECKILYAKHTSQDIRSSSQP